MRVVTYLFSLFVSLQSGLAFAQTGGEEDPASERATAFRAVEGPVEDSISGGGLMVAAYGVVLVLLVLYVMRLGRMHQRLSNDIARVQQGLAKTSSAAEDHAVD